ncbi:MAG: M20/M25/M40 family metallo-hydrolase [Gemmatimonadaceae bacterium]|nr:M20/M25/M40 family metallo-hydrolase [Gemmatimonadaceae bacterium]
MRAGIRPGDYRPSAFSIMPISIRFVLPALWTALVAPGLLPGQAAAPVPRKYIGPPTVAEITAGDLMTRVYKFADDSMMGRQVGTPYNDMGTAYIESEVRRLGLQPAGDNGTFFQKVPLFTRVLDSASTIAVDGATFTAGTDFTAGANGFTKDVANATPVFVGAWLDTTRNIPVDSARGRVLVFVPGGLAPGTDIGKFVASNGYNQWLAMRAVAAANVVVIGEALSPNALRNAFQSTTTNYLQDWVPLTLNVTRAVGEALFGAPATSWTHRMAGKPITTSVRFVDTPKPGRNVVAMLPGTDPALRHQYVAIGAHNDHVGTRAQGPVDHDSVRAFMQVVRPQGADSDPRPATAEELVRVKAIIDSLRAISAPRPDSIYNGADDDASGSMTVLEVAEQFARGREKPKRSILFVWHTGEEAGLWGANYFTARPTVPRDSIVAQINLDMVGRGGADDVTGEDLEGKLLRGGEGYVQLIGSRRLSTEMGDLVEAVNAEKQLGLRFDYSMDANGHPQNIYCRSDHYEYARYGIPVTFMSTGGHADYHQVTDEPQYLDYPRMAQIGRLVFESALRIGNLPHRLKVDKPKPDPKGSCVQ